MNVQRKLKHGAYEVGALKSGVVFVELQDTKFKEQRGFPLSAGVALTPDECERLICDLARALAEGDPERVSSAPVGGGPRWASAVASALGTLAAQGVGDE